MLSHFYNLYINDLSFRQDLAEKVEMGLTWIDHDTIDKPVEEFGSMFHKRLISSLLFNLKSSISIEFLGCAEEVKGIEFTVTTLNCAQDQNVVPEQRRKFSSLRKTGALSKAVRSKISKSFYSNSSSNKIDKATNVQAATNSDKSSDVQLSSKEKATVNAPESTTNLATTPTSKTDKPEKHKKRSKLCQLL